MGLGSGGVGIALKLMRMERERHAESRERNKERKRKRRKRLAREAKLLRERLATDEDDLARTLLVAIAANELLKQRGEITVEQISRNARVVDRWDGQSDNRVDPVVFRPDPPPPERAPTTGEFLDQLAENHEP